MRPGWHFRHKRSSPEASASLRDSGRLAVAAFARGRRCSRPPPRRCTWPCRPGRGPSTAGPRASPDLRCATWRARADAAHGLQVSEAAESTLGTGRIYLSSQSKIRASEVAPHHQPPSTCSARQYAWYGLHARAPLTFFASGAAGAGDACLLGAGAGRLLAQCAAGGLKVDDSESSCGAT